MAANLGFVKESGDVPAPDAPRAASARSPPVPEAICFRVSVHPGPKVDIDDRFGRAVVELEAALGMPLWVLIQNDPDGSYGTIDAAVYEAMRARCCELPCGAQVGIVLQSYGGDAHTAYRISRLIQRRCGSFVAIIPNFAKSAATLLALGSKALLFGQDSEIGPLDVQMFESDREEVNSALNAVQSLERINAFANNAIDQLMLLLVPRTNKKLDTLLPLVLTHVANFVRPLLENIDTVDFTKKSRELKVAEEYAIRLMTPNYQLTEAARIARALVENYPAHEFIIDPEESLTSKRLGLKRHEAAEPAAKILDRLATLIPKSNIIGEVWEITR